MPPQFIFEMQDVSKTFGESHKLEWLKRAKTPYFLGFS